MSVQAICFLTLFVMAVIAMAHGTAHPAVCPPASRRSYGWAMVLTVVLLVLMLTGCKTAPEYTPPVRLSCEPLPVCAIPPKATSTQLEMALWECVLEYRAQYSACANRQRQSP